MRKEGRREEEGKIGGREKWKERWKEEGKEEREGGRKGAYRENCEEFLELGLCVRAVFV